MRVLRTRSYKVHTMFLVFYSTGRSRLNDGEINGRVGQQKSGKSTIPCLFQFTPVTAMNTGKNSLVQSMQITTVNNNQLKYLIPTHNTLLCLSYGIHVAMHTPLLHELVLVHSLAGNMSQDQTGA